MRSNLKSEQAAMRKRAGSRRRYRSRPPRKPILNLADCCKIGSKMTHNEFLKAGLLEAAENKNLTCKTREYEKQQEPAEKGKP